MFEVKTFWVNIYQGGDHMENQREFLKLENEVRWQNFIAGCMMLDTKEDLDLMLALSYKGDLPKN